MQFISEASIDQVITQFAADKALFESSFQSFQESSPALSVYLTSEDFKVFLEGEMDLMIFLIAVGLQAIQEVEGSLPTLEIEELMEAEEQNWALIEDSKARSFRERLTIFFDKTSQEDLLAFVEDTLMDDEGLGMSGANREALFVSVISVYDAYANAIES